MTYQRLLEQLEPPGQELVLNVQEFAPLANITEGLTDHGKARVLLNLLPAREPVGHHARQQPVVMAPMPRGTLLPHRHRPVINKKLISNNYADSTLSILSVNRIHFN